MTARFFDTSALGRAFFEDEDGHVELRAWILDENAPTLISTLVRLEFVATCEALARGGRIPDAGLYIARLDALLVERFANIVAFDAEIIPVAERILRRRQLRTLDALHVATALAAQDSRHPPTDEVIFVTRDHAQADAARAEGLTVA